MFGSPEEQAQLSLAMRLLSGSGPSLTPVGVGGSLGNAMIGAMGDYNNLLQQAQQNSNEARSLNLQERGADLDEKTYGLHERKFKFEQDQMDRANEAMERLKETGLGGALASLAQQQGGFAPSQQAGIGMMSSAQDMATYMKGFDQTYGYSPPKVNPPNFQTFTSGDRVKAFNPENPTQVVDLGPAKSPEPPPDKSVDYALRINDDFSKEIKPVEQIQKSIRYIRSLLPDFRNPATSLNIKEAMSNLTETGSRAQAEVAAWQGGQFGNLSQRLIGGLTKFTSGRYTEDNVNQINDLINQLETNLVQPSMEQIIRGHADRAAAAKANMDVAIPGHYRAKVDNTEKPQRRYSQKPPGASDAEWEEYLTLTGGR